jgi:phosphatidylglycerophosphate synthase
VITEAALYLASPDDAEAAATPVAGHPVALRALMAAVRAGCRRVHVPETLRTPELDRAVAARPSARAAVAWTRAGSPTPEAALLLLPAAALTLPGPLVPLLGSSPPATLAGGDEHDPLVAVVTPARAAALWGSIAAGRPLGDDLPRALKEDGPMPVGRGWCRRVRGAQDAAAAEARLWSSLGSPIDSGLDRTVHRRLSRPVSRLAVAAGLTPNQVTLASLLVGLGAVWGFWRGTPVTALLGLALYAAAVVLDHADGEVARVTLTESAFGSRLDVAVDTAIHALLMLALGATAQRVAGGAGAITGAVAAAGVVGSAVLTVVSPAAARGGIGTALEVLSNRDGFYAMLLAFLGGLWLWPAALPGFMVLVAAGCHAFWLARLLYALSLSRR